MTPLIFFDTEFTDFTNPQLLSLGMVTHDGREFYAELDCRDPGNGAVFARAGDFVRSNVLSQWGRIPGAVMPQIGERAGDWLHALAEEACQPLILCFDFRTDYELLKRSLEDAGHWKHLRQRLRPVDIDDLTGRAEGLQAAAAELAQLRSRRIGLHHALADALALRAAYLAVTQPIGGAR